MEFLKKYNPDLWSVNDGVYECVSEAEYLKNLKEASSTEEEVLDTEDRQGETREAVENRFATMELSEEIGVQNFSQSLLIKGSDLMRTIISYKSICIFDRSHIR